MQTEEWGELHDKQLLGLAMTWESGELRMRVGATDRTWEIVATGVRRFECTRLDPWGHSELVNDVRGPVPLVDGVVWLEVELQSGDLLRIEARKAWLETVDC